MAHSPEPSFDELLWTIAMARLILPADISLQVPPNLNLKYLDRLFTSGINDLGGISPVTKDYVNPEAPWPEIQNLAKIAFKSNQSLKSRATLYPKYFSALSEFSSREIASKLLDKVDAQFLIRSDNWQSGISTEIPQINFGIFCSDIKQQIQQVEINPSIESIQRLLESSDGDFQYLSLIHI